MASLQPESSGASSRDARQRAHVGASRGQRLNSFKRCKQADRRSCIGRRGEGGAGRTRARLVGRWHGFQSPSRKDDTLRKLVSQSRDCDRREFETLRLSGRRISKSRPAAATTRRYETEVLKSVPQTRCARLDLLYASLHHASVHNEVSLSASFPASALALKTITSSRTSSWLPTSKTRSVE